MAFDSAEASCIRTACALCPVRGCIASGDRERSALWPRLVSHHIAVIPGGAPLFNAGERPRAVFVVRGGCLKSYTLDASGKERIRGFHFTGEMVGLDALGSAVHTATVAAVEASQVCVVPLETLQSSVERWPELSRQVLDQISRELSLALAIAGDCSVEQRLAAFLLDLQQRIGVSGVLRLPMGQREIGGYLRMANETVCRTFKELVHRGWLSIQGRKVRILDHDRLAELAEPVGIADGSLPRLLAA